jgi:hypothetical protein
VHLLRDLLAGKQHDIEKQISHGIALGLGTKAKLSRMQPAKLVAALVAAVLDKKHHKVKNAVCIH